ncbi:MAG: gamma-glutamyltransferase [Gammaproteobacteria bacterium]|nr:gamma-glutamyltransferase [Gammaproteobacteria bacterium]
MKIIIPSFLLLLLSACSQPGQQSAAIASAHPLATEAGEQILNAGGNAFDAAIAVTTALAVVEPYSSGIGGGGFWLLHQAGSRTDIMLDGREKAPLNAHRDMYLDEQGNVIKGASMDGPLAAGIPGVPAALQHLAERYGRLPLATSLQPAIRYARDGFEVDEHYRRMAGFRLQALNQSVAAAEIFLHQGQVPELGYKIVQTDLAATLSLIAQQGANGFYKGKLAQQLVKGVQAAGGIWTLEDLSRYQLLEREPLVGHYKGMTITSVAPPSSGGVALIEILNQLSLYPLQQMNESQQLHRVVEAMRRAYRDRAEYLGDTDFVEVPVARLIDPMYAAGLQATIHPEKATPSNLLPGVLKLNPSQDTSHFSIIDHEGNRVAATLSINYPFGACFVPPGTGVLLNDEMDDFSAKPGIPNAYGLVGAEANAIEPGKRMLSSMSPTFLETDNRLAVMGTPGGSRIITMVLLGALGFHQGLSADEIVKLPRYHHQYLPDQVFYEPGAIADESRERLSAMGHQMTEASATWGNMQLVIWDKQQRRISAASDPRGIGQASVVKEPLIK